MSLILYDDMTTNSNTPPQLQHLDRFYTVTFPCYAVTLFFSVVVVLLLWSVVVGMDATRRES